MVSAAQGGYMNIVQAILNFWTEHGQDDVSTHQGFVESANLTLLGTIGSSSTESISSPPTYGVNRNALNRAADEALSNGYEDIVRLLLDNGGSFSRTLSQAATYEQESCVRMLRKLGANTDSVNYEGRNAMCSIPMSA
jgi:hypothetical protein